MAYNRYRKRHYNISKTKARDYAEQMEDLEKLFDEGGKHDDWSISGHLDSCYKYFDNYRIRLSNHSADNQYHDVHNGNLIVNIKSSKLDFSEKIQKVVPKVIDQLNEIDLDKYRFINVVDERVNCFHKNFKTKKDVFTLDFSAPEAKMSVSTNPQSDDLTAGKDQSISIKEIVLNDIGNSINDNHRYYDESVWQDQVEALKVSEDDPAVLSQDKDVKDFYKTYKSEIEREVSAMADLLMTNKHRALGLDANSPAIDYKRSGARLAYNQAVLEISNEMDNRTFSIPAMSEDREHTSAMSYSVEME